MHLIISHSGHERRFHTDDLPSAITCTIRRVGDGGGGGGSGGKRGGEGGNLGPLQPSAAHDSFSMIGRCGQKHRS